MIGDIQHELNQALAEEHAKRGLTKAEISRILGRDKSFVSRKLNGASNMTLETLADIAFALNRPVRISLPDRDKMGGGNNHVTYSAATTTNGAVPSVQEKVTDPRVVVAASSPMGVSQSISDVVKVKVGAW
ncbi:helix-turn-helix domain-containing protein [Azospirillum canadense]|uniref:helix-turn-helix domain-containing protein n=1 Tax=Azospirillum canadense TaxID=403962 RepID=UPI0022266F95|nr:helix-turn-helix transcriptional regulator [Azospirillum canadense]MCW2242772.1 hypothetical protein [Azospirillum canadense]